MSLHKNKFNQNMLMAKKFKILLPFDNSPNSLRALSKAAFFANKTHGSVTLVHVISYNQAMAKIVGPYKGKLISHVDEFMEKAKKRLSSLGVSCQTKILYGNPAKEVLKLDQTHDLVVIGRRGTSKLTGPSLGSVSNAIVQSSKVPVLVVK